MLKLEVRDHCAAVPVPGYLPVFTATVSGLLSLVAVPCNIFVCLTIMKSPPQFKSLRTPFTYFILNLAATDLLVGAVTEPVSVVYHFMHGSVFRYLSEISQDFTRSVFPSVYSVCIQYTGINPRALLCNFQAFKVQQKCE